MVEEPDSGPDPDLLGTVQLGGVVVRRLRRDGGIGRDALGGEVCVVGKEVEGSAVEGEGDLDLGFVGVAVDEGGAAGRRVGHYGEKGVAGSNCCLGHSIFQAWL